jgi:hypothetical protein
MSKVFVFVLVCAPQLFVTGTNFIWALHGVSELQRGAGEIVHKVKISADGYPSKNSSYWSAVIRHMAPNNFVGQLSCSLAYFA